MTTADPDTLTTVRDLAFANPPVVDEAWTLANNTLAAERTAEQRAALAASDQLIAELITADTLVIGCPIYNFAIPAPLKAWLVQICRARVTFTYSDNGPKGSAEHTSELQSLMRISYDVLCLKQNTHTTV